jgi:hypothetical protein
MAEETLVKEALTEQMIEAGDSVTRVLDKSGWPVVASFWSFDPEFNRWRLLLASPEVDSRGPLDGYRRVDEALQRFYAALHIAATVVAPQLSLDDVSVISPNDKRVQVLANAFPPPNNLTPRRVHRTVIGGYYFDDVYFYKLPDVASAA